MEGEEARGLADGLRVPDTQTGEFEEGLGSHLSENQKDLKFTVKVKKKCSSQEGLKGKSFSR